MITRAGRRRRRSPPPAPHHFVRLAVDGLPDGAVRAVAELLDDLVPVFGVVAGKAAFRLKPLSPARHRQTQRGSCHTRSPPGARAPIPGAHRFIVLGLPGRRAWGAGWEARRRSLTRARAMPARRARLAPTRPRARSLDRISSSFRAASSCPGRGAAGAGSAEQRARRRKQAHGARAVCCLRAVCDA